MTRIRRILISGYYGFSNTGDEAVLSAIVSGLKRLGGEGIEITVLSASPEETTRLHGVESLPRTSMREVSEAIRRSDLVISGGGSLIQDATSLRSLLYYLWIIRLGKRYGRRVMVLGQGIGPLRRGISRQISRRVLNRADLITVRDPVSAQLLKEIGVSGPPVHVTADPAFMLEPAPGAHVAAHASPEPTRPSALPDVIALALREWPETPEIERAATQSLKEVAGMAPARLFLMGMHAPEDLEMAGRIREAVGNTAVAQAETLTPEELLALVGASKMVVGMRLHALIFAAATGVPMLGITYDPKVESFLSAVGQECMSLDDLKAGALAGRIMDAWNRREELASRLAERVPPMRDAAERNIRLALELLEGSWSATA